MRLPTGFAKAIELAIDLGAKSIGDLPGCWEHCLDAEWWIAINGHAHPTKCSVGATVPPFSLYVQFNGFPAGIIDAAGGIICAGSIANEETFLAAIERARKAAA